MDIPIPQTRQEAAHYLSLVKCWSMDNPQSREDSWHQDLERLLSSIND